jgi:rhamnosyltransferase
MKSNTAVIKVLYNKIKIDHDEVDKICTAYKYYLIINNSSCTVGNQNIDVSNFKIINNFNSNGLSGAYNLGISSLIKIDPKFVLFLDDDTNTNHLYNLYDELFYSDFENTNVAAIAPMYIDSNSNTRGSHILLSRFSFKRIPRNYKGIYNVSFMINSSSVWRFDALKKIGKFDECMKVDLIDTDYCLRAIESGYSIIMNSNYLFVHTIGNRISYRFLFKKFRSGNHSPERRKMIMMNNVIILRKHFFKYPILLIVILSRIIYEFLGIILAESSKNEKLIYSFKGLLIGMFKPLEHCYEKKYFVLV